MPSQTSHTKPSRFTVGLTGGIGSGKTTVANLFATHGAAIIDTDVIAHQLTTPDGKAIAAIRDTFGNDFIAANGAMNRVKMREHVFSDHSAKLRLEAILHPLIRAETALAAEQAVGAYVILVVPLLVESGNWRRRANRILVVDCDEATQIERVLHRDKQKDAHNTSRSTLNEAQVRAIMATQASRQQRLAVADDVITNNVDTASLEQQVTQLHVFYSSLR
ncbi:dephospho-CoA kinase [Glaciimonas soli]|uniref:Dephospho-CoA kinase n=1 Tax=Glaciimonas soli TaxID=2590999 RepID=A0A843YX43_9BURK|nr:dephospho-CoA kinase [Glaciimonas soli]MQR02244.1 dephospho-CoA kinase [Glaciimonas soli]